MKKIIFLLSITVNLYAQEKTDNSEEGNYSLGINVGGIPTKRIEILNEYKLKPFLSINNSLGYYLKAASYDYINSYDNKVRGPFLRIGPRLLFPAKNSRFYLGSDFIVSRVYHSSVIKINDFYSTIEQSSSFIKNVVGFSINMGVVLLSENIRVDMGFRYNPFSIKQNPLVTRKGFLQPGFGTVIKNGSNAVSLISLLAIRYNFLNKS